MFRMLYCNYIQKTLDLGETANKSKAAADLPFCCLKVRPSPKNWFCTNQTINQKDISVLYVATLRHSC